MIDTDSAFLIDTGLGISSIKNVVNKITSLPVRVITTHVHTDHIGNHHEFESIVVHKKEVDWLIHGIPGLSHEIIVENLMRDIRKPISSEFNINNFSVYKGTPTIVLHDNDVLDAGHRIIKILRTLGHSLGHLSILDIKYGFLFTGDILYVDTPIYAFYPSNDPKELLFSLEKLTQFNGLTTIYGSHNTLGINPSVLKDVKQAIEYLRNNDLDHWGTGVHKIKNIAFQF